MRPGVGQAGEGGGVVAAGGEGGGGTLDRPGEEVEPDQVGQQGRAVALGAAFDPLQAVDEPVDGPGGAVGQQGGARQALPAGDGRLGRAGPVGGEDLDEHRRPVANRHGDRDRRGGGGGGQKAGLREGPPEDRHPARGRAPERDEQAAGAAGERRGGEAVDLRQQGLDPFGEDEGQVIARPAGQVVPGAAGRAAVGREGAGGLDPGDPSPLGAARRGRAGPDAQRPAATSDVEGGPADPRADRERAVVEPGRLDRLQPGRALQDRRPARGVVDGDERLDHPAPLRGQLGEVDRALVGERRTDRRCSSRVPQIGRSGRTVQTVASPSTLRETVDGPPDRPGAPPTRRSAASGGSGRTARPRPSSGPRPARGPSVGRP